MKLAPIHVNSKAIYYKIMVISEINYMYILSFFTKVLHFLPGEISHSIALKGLKLIHFLGFLEILLSSNRTDNKKNSNYFINKQTKLSILNCNNKLGLAAGLDKNGEYIDCLAALGVGFIEVGTVTPKSQYGNAKPRLFRNKKDKWKILNKWG